MVQKSTDRAEQSLVPKTIDNDINRGLLSFTHLRLGGYCLGNQEKSGKMKKDRNGQGKSGSSNRLSETKTCTIP